LPTVWRITKTGYTPQAFTGAGAALYGGRWNSKGHQVIYVSETLALALLETLVHLPRPRHLRNHSAAEVTVPPALVQTVARLPRSWKRNQPATRRIGDQWVRSQSTPVLAVPSAMFESGRAKPMNYLLNPNHPDFAQLTIGRFARLDIDPRIV
jgi:RES domain-containing protein